MANLCFSGCLVWTEKLNVLVLAMPSVLCLVLVVALVKRVLEILLLKLPRVTS